MKPTPMQNFLIVYHHGGGGLLSAEGHGTNVDSALAAYAAAETRYRNQPAIEVVLIASDSLDTIRETHSNYFDQTVVSSRFLAGI